MNARLLELAEQAGLQPYYESQQKHIKRFAELVRANEREACAKLCEQLAQPEQELKLTNAGADTNIEPFTLYPKGSGMVTLNHPEQKPVAWMYKGNFHDFDPSEWASPEFVVTPLYTAPPRKEWVELTDEQLSEIYNDLYTQYTTDDVNIADFILIARTIENDLKEKNA